MATSSFSPSLYQAPLGIDDSAETESPVEISIDNPDGVSIEADGVVVDLMPGEDTPGGEDFDANLAALMPPSALQSLGSELIALVDEDMNSRKEWVDIYVKGLEVLGMRYEERTEPWAGACGVFSTILTEAAIRFQSETILETFPAAGPVKTEIIGAIDQLKEEAAARVCADMNYRLTEEMPEYRVEHERMLYNLGLAGTAFKKVYYDPSLARQVAMFIPAEDLIIPYGASSCRTSERVTHVMRKTKNELKQLQAKGFYTDADLGEPVKYHSDIEERKAEDQGFSLINDDRFALYEVHTLLDLKGYEDPDGLALPYVVTVDKGTGEVLAIRRNWREEDKLKLKRHHFVQYSYVIGFGAYGLGLIHIIGGYARAGTSIVRQLIDAGTLSNLPGGLKSRGLRIKGDDTPISPGEFRDVDVPSGTIQQNVMTLPYKEPSQVLALLLQQITEDGRRLGSIADMNISDMSANAPVGTTLALLERQLKTMSAVQARVHYSMKEEFKLLKEIIREHTPAEYGYEPAEGDRTAKQADYDMVDVIPVSDPNSATMAQRIMQYQAAIQLAQGAPQIYDLPQLHRQMLSVLGIKNAEKLVPIDDDMKPRDPVSENMAFLTGKPTKAFIYQDQDAHIAVHTAMMQDPMVMGQIGQNPQAQGIQAAIMAHIAEHVAFQYRSKLQEQLGATLPLPDTDMAPEVEMQLSSLVAQAAQQLLTINKGQQAQQQAQQQQQDPMFQLEQQKVQILGQEAQTKAQKVQGELQIAQQTLALKEREGGQQPQQGPNPQQVQQEMAQGNVAHQQQMAIQAQVAQQQAARSEQQHQLQLRAVAAQQQASAFQAAQKARHAEQLHAAKLQQIPGSPAGEK